MSPPNNVGTNNNPALWAGQVRGFRSQQLKMEAGIRTLQERLARWRADSPPRGRRPTPATVAAYLRRLGRGREPAPFLQGTCTPDTAGALTIVVPEI